jgi:hypothetical protein
MIGIMWRRGGERERERIETVTGLKEDTCRNETETEVMVWP